MEIVWHGNTCFTIKDKESALVINPSKENLKGNFVLSSLKNEIPTVEGSMKTFDWPGEYEIKGVPIIGFPAATGTDDDTIIFYFEVGKVKLCHLGELGEALTNEMVKEIDDVDVLMIKAGKGTNLSLKKAVEIIEAIDPRVIIPMGDNDPQELLKELGADQPENTDKFVLKSRSELPEDKRRYVLFNQA